MSHNLKSNHEKGITDLQIFIRRDEGIALAKANGADVVVDAGQEKKKVVEEVMKVTKGKGVDSTVNVSDAQGAAALACAVTKMHGTMIQIAQVIRPFRPRICLCDPDIRIAN